MLSKLLSIWAALACVFTGVLCYAQEVPNTHGQFEFLTYVVESQPTKTLWRPATAPNPKYPGDDYLLKIDGVNSTYDLYRVLGIHTILLPTTDRVITWGYGIQPSHDLGDDWDPILTTPKKAFTAYLLWDFTKLYGESDGDRDVLGLSKYCNDQSDALDTNIFCSGHSLLMDGRLFVSGRHLNTEKNIPGVGLRDVVVGVKNTYLFDSAGPAWTLRTDAFLNEPRWYPSHVSMPDGRVLIVGGVKMVGDPDNQVPEELTTEYEVYDHFGQGGESMSQYGPYPSSNLGNIYPWVHLLSTGWVSYTGPFGWMYSLDLANLPSNWRTFTSIRPTRIYGTTVLLPTNNKDTARANPNYLNPTSAAEQGLNSVMVFGGDNNGTVLSSTEIVLWDPNDRDASKGNSPKPKSNPYGTPPSMSSARKYGYAALLPNGKIFVVGGTSSPAATAPVLGTQLFDPEGGTAGTFTAMATMDSATPRGTLLPNGARMYHSTALLLPSGKILVCGTDWLYNSQVYENRYPTVYTPPWFFDSQGNEDPDLRPTLDLTTNPQTGYGLGWEFPVTYTLPANRTIHSVVIVRPGSVTHSFDMEQRLVRLKWTTQGQPAGTILTYGPFDPAIAPPGWYMMFLVDSAGSYSEGRWVQILPDSWLMRPGGSGSKGKR